MLHARVFGLAVLTPDTVIGAFVDGARVRADSLIALADRIAEDETLGQDIRRLLGLHLPPAEPGAPDAVLALTAMYSAQEQAAVMIAARLDRA